MMSFILPQGRSTEYIIETFWSYGVDACEVYKWHGKYPLITRLAALVISDCSTDKWAYETR